MHRGLPRHARYRHRDEPAGHREDQPNQWPGGAANVEDNHGQDDGRGGRGHESWSLGTADHLTVAGRAASQCAENLGVDHVDLFQIHRWDPETSDEETLAVLTELRLAGKIRHFGTSTYPAYRIVQAQWAARERELGSFTTEQPQYSILQRAAEAHVLPVAQEYALGVLAWSPLASGWLTGAVRTGQEVATNRSSFMPHRFDPEIPANRAKLKAVEQLIDIADQAGLSLIQLALGFVIAHPGVTSALIGPRTLEHLESQLAAADTVLTDDVLDAIDKVVAPGTDLAPEEKNDQPPSLLDPRLRRH